VFGLLLGTGLGYIYFGSNTIQQMVRDYRQGRWNPEKAFPSKDDITVLFLGKDVDRDHRGRIVDTNARTDTILLAHLNFTNKTASILSIPRDTRVHIPGYRGRHKINAAHAYGGPELTMQTIDEFLGIRADQYVVVDYGTFEKAIDLIGGLRINVAKQMDYDDNWGNLHIHLKPGLQKLDGNQALGYVRFRKSNDGHGDTDYDRIARQQQFLLATKEKMMSTSTFLNLPNIIDTVHSGVNSSMSDAQLMTIAKFIRSLPSSSIRTATLPGTEGRVYVATDDNAVRRLIQEMFY
jgi:LCP family protein required for cell wall assembly